VDSTPLVQQGIDAYKAGNKEEAVRLLSEAIRENGQDENAWLYLGAALDDPTRKRQAFERVLAINPNNERAKNALTRLSGGATAPAGATSSAPAPNMPSKPKSGEGFKVPFEVDGAPDSLTIPYIMDTARIRAQQGIDIYTKQDYEQVVTAGANVTQWDSVFIAGVGAAAMGAAALFGKFIGFFLGGFFGGFGGLIIGPIVGAIIGVAATAAGFAAAVYASRAYLQNQGVNVSMPQHSMYYAMVWLPIILVNAALSFVANAIGLLIVCLFPLFFLVGIALLIYSWIILRGALDRVYGSQNNRGLITAAIAVIAGGLGSAVVSGILGVILSPLMFNRP